MAGWAVEHRIVILAGLIERDGDHVHNSHVICYPDGRREVQRKHILTPGELAAGLTVGPVQRQLITLKGVRCALVICADGGSAAIAADCQIQKVQLRFCPTAGGGPRSDIMSESELATSAGLARYAAERNKVFQPLAIMPLDALWPSAWASANALGHDGVTEQGWHRGHCMITDRHGIIRAQLPGTCILEQQQDLMAHARLNFPAE
jgi:predicted amidohydrolase